MENRLANPLRNVVDGGGGAPDTVWKAAGAGFGLLGALVARKLLDALRAKLEVVTRATIVLSTPFERRPLLSPS